MKPITTAAEWDEAYAQLMSALTDGHPNPEGFLEHWLAQNPRPEPTRVFTFRPEQYCITHKRQATHTDANGHPCCNPKLGGILIPCKCAKTP